MAIKNFKQHEIVAEDGITKATIVPERGGFVASLILPFQSDAREALFLHDFAWDNEIDDLVGGIPFLFPVCARLSRNGNIGEYLYDAKLYQLKIHGFSWYRQWLVDKQQNDRLRLVLRSDQDTLKVYPFEFEVYLDYRVTPGKLTCRVTVKNCDIQKMMPYYGGFHPYFATPKPGEDKEKVILDFSPIRHFTYNDDLTDIIGEEKNINTPVSITDKKINEQLSVLGRNKIATLKFNDNDVLFMEAKGETDPDLFDYLQLYTIPEKPFFCVERWMSFPNALNTVSGARQLAPGHSETGVFEIFV